MTPEIAVLRALLRLARRRSPATLEQLLVRVDADADDVLYAVRQLARAGLVHTEKNVPRLTMTGFAIAVAMTAAVPKQTKKKPASPARVVPLVRRRRAA
jgi:predicted transcriptional regulator